MLILLSTRLYPANCKNSTSLSIFSSPPGTGVPIIGSAQEGALPEMDGTIKKPLEALGRPVKVIFRTARMLQPGYK